MKTANKCYLAKPADRNPDWFIVDATDQVLGRLAVRIATVLMGKHKPTYTPHVDMGDHVIVLNAHKIRVTGKKDQEIVYQRYSRYPSGLRETTLAQQRNRQPERILEEAVRRMLPKNKLARNMLKKLKLYNGTEHQHQAQQPVPLPN